MIWAFLAVLWILFLMILVSSLIGVRRGAQVLGINLPREKCCAAEVVHIVRRHRWGIIAITLLFLALSFVLLIPMVKPYAGFLILVLTVGDLFAAGFCFSRAQKALLRLRREKGWEPPLKPDVTVDLSVSREKGMSAVPSAFVWLFFVLSFVPLAAVLLLPALRASVPIVIAAVGPLCQLLFTALYYQARRMPARLTSADTDLAQMLARRTERIRTAGATAMALIQLLFWLCSFLSCVFHVWAGCIAATALYAILLLCSAGWQQRRLNRLEESVQAVTEQTHPEPDRIWRWGCYYNPADLRLFVPKRAESLGWTINLTRPAGKVIFASIWVLVAAVILLAIFAGTRGGFAVEINGDAVTFDAALYDLTVTRDDVTDITVIDEIPSGTRTNGYGGMSKSYGHFHLDEYGNCMIYIYHDTPCAVVLTIDGEPGHVLVNAETAADTQALYGAPKAWGAEK